MNNEQPPQSQNQRPRGGGLVRRLPNNRRRRHLVQPGGGSLLAPRATNGTVGSGKRYESTGPDGVHVRGALCQIHQRYKQLEKLSRDGGNEAYVSENFAQHAEHYLRMLGETPGGRALASGDSQQPAVSGRGAGVSWRAPATAPHGRAPSSVRFSSAARVPHLTESGFELESDADGGSDFRTEEDSDDGALVSAGTGPITDEEAECQDGMPSFETAALSQPRLAESSGGQGPSARGGRNQAPSSSPADPADPSRLAWASDRGGGPVPGFLASPGSAGLAPEDQLERPTRAADGAAPPTAPARRRGRAGTVNSRRMRGDPVVRPSDVGGKDASSA